MFKAVVQLRKNPFLPSIKYTFALRGQDVTLVMMQNTRFYGDLIPVCFLFIDEVNNG